MREIRVVFVRKLRTRRKGVARSFERVFSAYVGNVQSPTADYWKCVQVSRSRRRVAQILRVSSACLALAKRSGYRRFAVKPKRAYSTTKCKAVTIARAQHRILLFRELHTKIILSRYANLIVSIKISLAICLIILLSSNIIFLFTSRCFYFEY